MDQKTGEPVEFATVLVKSTEQWSVTDEKGQFTISGITVASSKVEIASLGYVTLNKEVTFDKSVTEQTFKLFEDNLTLESAVVTAQENGNSATTSRTIDKTALEHVQVMNVTDISAILIGHLLNGESLRKSTREAMDALYRLIDANKDNEDKNRGIPVERWLRLL